MIGRAEWIDCDPGSVVFYKVDEFNPSVVVIRNGGDDLN
jgi:hypothetical protein